MSTKLYACGDDQIRQYEITDGAAVEIWRWSASTAKTLPVAYRETLLKKIDECKPVDHGRAILATASTGGVVLIDRASGAVRFRATAAMAHSADVLPGGRIAIALSIDPAGDKLEVYDMVHSEAPLFHLVLPSGHGVVWDARRKRLFALSRDHIQAFALCDWATKTPSLIQTSANELPGKQEGHDLSHDPASGSYYVTTVDGVWQFDPDVGTLTPFKPLNPAANVKAISANATTIVWMRAEESWWAHGFSIAARADGRARRVETPDLHLYKLRLIRWVRG